MLKPILGTSGGDEPRRSVARQGTDRRGTWAARAGLWPVYRGVRDDRSQSGKTVGRL